MLGCTKVFVCGKHFWSKKDFCLQKTFLFMENLFDQLKFFCRKHSCLCKISTIVKNFLTVRKLSYCGKVPGLWKISKTLEILQGRIYQGKFTFLTAKKRIGLIILKSNASVKTIKTYILSLEQKLSLLTLFAVDKINIIFSRSLKHKYETFNVWQQQRFIDTKSNL